jgi:hypothetical protein
MLHGLDNQSNLVGGGGEAFYTREARTRGPAGKKFMFRDKLAGGGGQTGEITVGGTKAFLFVSFPQSSSWAGWGVGNEGGIGWMGSGK